MAKKRKKRNFFSKKIIFIASIVAINFTGISYASWYENPQISTIIKTGNIDPVFSNKDIEINDAETIWRFNIENQGSIPVKFVGYDQEGTSNNLSVDLYDLDSLLNQRNIGEEKFVLYPEAENNLFSEDCEVKIVAEKPKEPGTYTYRYKIKLLFQQWTDN